MKISNQFKQVALGVTLFTAAAVLVPFLARASGESSGGGDPIALEFKQAAYSAAREVLAMNLVSSSILQNLIPTIDSAQVFVTADALSVALNNFQQQSAAVNMPADLLILVNPQRWSAIQDNDTRKALALHEILSLMKLERTADYSISGRYLDTLTKRSSSIDSAGLVAIRSEKRCYRRGWNSENAFLLVKEIVNANTGLVIKLEVLNEFDGLQYCLASL
ncbi:MAG TPA: hypothetical protein VJB59_02995 [Bdellovibrionota bacterium]|nr:hypothetical protein [Bdellovibrionota bacterium]